MVKLRGRLGLAFKAHTAFLVGAKMRRKELQGDFAVQLRVFCQVHLTHATGTDFIDYLVVRNLSALDQDFVRLRFVVIRSHSRSHISPSAP